MKKIYLLLLLLIAGRQMHATTHQVGPTRLYTSPNALYTAGVIQDGDVIEIDYFTYSGNSTLAYWNRNNITIRGVGGRPVLKAAGSYIFGKGIWVTAGNNMVIENIEFADATCPDKNGAGIRMDSGSLTIKNCYFHDSENGILTSALGSSLTVEHSEFANNGYGDGYSHNIYVGNIDTFTFRYNYSHHAKVGHLVKSRAKNNLIYSNRLSDESTGNSSRMIDLPNGGFSIIMGNILVKGPNAINNNLIGYGVEGLTNANVNLYVINNTLINKRTASGIFVALQSGTVSEIRNNIFGGIGTIYAGTPTIDSNNLNNTNLSTFGFMDEANFDFHLKANSTAIDAGTTLNSTNGYSLVPDREYVHPAHFSARPTVGVIDIGAYEFQGTLKSSNAEKKIIKLYPNPFSDYINIEKIENISSIAIYTLDGKMIKEVKEITNKLNLSSIASGLYLMKIITKDKKHLSIKIIKF